MKCLHGVRIPMSLLRHIQLILVLEKTVKIDTAPQFLVASKELDILYYLHHSPWGRNHLVYHPLPCGRSNTVIVCLTNL